MEIAPEIQPSDAQAVEKLIAGRARVETELSKVIIGQKDVVEQILLALFSGGHCLITGAPGLAKARARLRGPATRSGTTRRAAWCFRA